MDKASVLCEKDGSMMHEFSRRSLELVHTRSLLSRTLSFFSSYLEGNIKKEVDKDGLIIREAAAAYAAGRPACDLDLEELFERTKEIDKAFLDGLLIPSFTISVRYSDFADIRIQRIWLIIRTVYALLKNWPDTASFRDAVTKAFSGNEFREIITEILRLYDLETRMLEDAIRSPFRKSISEYLETLYRAMETVKRELADEYTNMFFGDRTIHA
jgi:hypothetical protein